MTFDLTHHYLMTLCRHYLKVPGPHGRPGGRLRVTIVPACATPLCDIAPAEAQWLLDLAQDESDQVQAVE